MLLSTRLHCKWPSALTNLKLTKTLLQSAATQRKLPLTVPVSRLFLQQLVQVLPVTWARLQLTLPLSAPTKAISKPTRIMLVLLASKSWTTLQATLPKITCSELYPQLLHLVVLLSTPLLCSWSSTQTLINSQVTL